MKQLTKARVGALHVLAAGPARYSNETIVFSGLNGAIHRHVHHQPADWLCEQGYALNIEGVMHITDAGRERLHEEVTGARV